MPAVEAKNQVIFDVPELIGSHKLGRYQILVLALCATLMFSSGFNLLTLGYLAPAVTADLKLRPGGLGIVFVMMGVGQICGAFAWGPIADRIGRARAIIIALLCSVPFIFLLSRADSVASLTVLQLLASFMLAGPQYNCMPLASDFMPRHLKVTLTVLVWAGFSVGTILVSPYAAFVVDIYGWRSVFVVNSAMPIALAAIAALWLPESLKQLLHRPNTAATIGRTLRRMFPDLAIPPEAQFITSERQSKGFPGRMLFTEGRARFTLLIWITGFANFISLCFMNSWLTTVLHNAGFVIGTAILIAAVVHVGGIVGAIFISSQFDKRSTGRFYVLSAAFTLSGVFIAVVGFSGADPIWTTAAIFVAGFFLYGTENCFFAVFAVLYPTEMRSTGAGWAAAVCTLAQLVGPMLGGVLLSLGWPSNQLLYVIALPPLISALGATALNGASRAMQGELETYARPVSGAR